LSKNKHYQSNIKKFKYKLTEQERAALKAIGKFVSKAAKQKAPKSMKKRSYKDKAGVLKSFRPGRLRKGISYWVRRKEKAVQVGTKSFYGVFLEKGTSEMSAQPWLMPAVEENVLQIQQMIKTALKEIERG